MKKLPILIKEAQEGDTEAMLQIIQLFEPKMYKVINQLQLESKEDIEDCSSEMTIKLIEAIYKINLEQMSNKIER